MLTVTPAGGSVGAYVDGVDLCSITEPAHVDDRRALLDVWHRYGVLFFRDQHLSDAEHLLAAGVFGEPEFFAMAPSLPGDLKNVHIIEVEPGRRFSGVSTWHTDATWKEHPPKGSMLRAIQLPKFGGDTLFASAHQAYQNLSSPLRALVDTLTATHHGGSPLRHSARQVGVEIPEEPVIHPLVRFHPVTGEPCLFVNRLFTKKINEVTPRESEILLPMLCDQFKDPEIQCRFRWEAGDVAIWDNRAVQHYASPDYEEARLMHRVVLAGEPAK